MWPPKWNTFGVKFVGQLEEFGLRFFLARTPNMGQIGLICWIMNISSFNLPLKNIQPKIMPICFTCDELGLKNLDKDVLD